MPGTMGQQPDQSGGAMMGGPMTGGDTGRMMPMMRGGGCRVGYRDSAADDQPTRYAEFEKVCRSCIRECRCRLVEEAEFPGRRSRSLRDENRQSGAADDQAAPIASAIIFGGPPVAGSGQSTFSRRLRGIFETKDAELKPLRCSRRGGVFVSPSADQLECGAKCLAEAFRIVSHHRQTAAPLGAFRRKRGDDGMASRSEGSPEAVDISCSVVRFGQKMESGPVVPHVIGFRRFPCGYVRNQPLHLGSKLAEPSVGGRQRGAERSNTVARSKPAATKPSKAVMRRLRCR
jgi:hypothetical protein